MERNQFTFYQSYWETIKHLPTKKEKLQAFELITDYALNRHVEDLEQKKPSAVAAFLIIKPQLDRAHERAERMLTGNNKSATTDPSCSN